MDALAKEVYNLIKGLPPESAKIVAGMLVSEGVHYDLGDYDVSKAYAEHCAKQADVVKRQLIRQYISKRQNGEDIESIVAMATAIAKAEETTEQRRENARHERRGAGGRFAAGHWKHTKPGRAGHKLIVDAEGNPARERLSTLDTIDALARAANTHLGGMGEPQYEGLDRQAFVPGVAHARRVGQGANFLQATVGGYLPPSAQIGLHTASFVGHYGSQAQQAFGPSIDRAKYRYKGTERKLSRKLASAINDDRRNARQHNRKYAEQVTIGGTKTTARRPGGPGRETYEPSETIKYFQDHLPDEKMARLQRASGHQPPSQGIIITKDGKVGAQMVGHGDDWFLPFDLKNLGELKGGQYIRTRTHGGLSTEDVYTGLMSGAHQMTVVSHNGIYTMTFDPTLRGSRRYSQTARQMTARYGQLLDAVKNGQVRVHTLRDVDPAKVTDLMAQADGDPNVYSQLLNEQYNKPIPSEALQRQWSDHFLTELAGQMHHRDGSPMSWDEFRDQELLPAMDEQILRSATIHDEQGNPVGPVDPFLTDPENVRRQSEAQLMADPAQAVAAFAAKHGSGIQNRYKDFMTDNLYNYRAQLRPLELDGEGYDFAAKALKEQFPYFIEDVQWRAPERGRGAIDRGYVKPRYTRSADVREGYFDPSILGYGKVPADRTRYQNARVRSTIETGYLPPGKDAEGREHAEFIPPRRGGEQREAPPTTPTETGPRVQPTAPTPEARKVQRDADLEAARHILAKQSFGENFAPPGYQNPPKGQDFQAHRTLDWMKEDYPEFTRNIGDYEAMDDDRLHTEVGKMVKKAQDTRMFDDLDQFVMARHKSRGGPINPADLTDLGEIDPATTEDFNFGPEFASGHSRDHYSRLWQDRTLSTVRDTAQVQHIQDPDVDQKLTDYIEDEQAYGQDAAAQGDNTEAARATRNILNALKMKQLARNWHRGGQGGGTPPSSGGSSGGGGGNQPAPLKIGPTQMVGGGGTSGTTSTAPRRIPVTTGYFKPLSYGSN